MKKHTKQRLVYALRVGVTAILCTVIAFWLGIHSAEAFNLIPVASSLPIL